MNNTGSASCQYCGAVFRLFSIFNRGDMMALCRNWRRRHERRCKDRTPEQRRAWARKYLARDPADSSLRVDLAHPGFAMTEPVCGATTRH